MNVEMTVNGKKVKAETPPSLLPNKDKALRKSATSFQADAKQRHPYKADAPKAGSAVARAQMDSTGSFRSPRSAAIAPGRRTPLSYMSSPRRRTSRRASARVRVPAAW